MSTRIKKVKKGFTLLEILLVIAAIGILAAIVLIAINPTKQIAQVRNAQRRSDINTIYKALEQYLIDNKDYPIGIGNTAAPICNTGTEQVGGSTDCAGKVDLRVLVPTYIAAIPKDPSGGVYEVYRNSDNNRIGVKAPGVELGQSIAVNPISTTPPQGLTSCPTGYILVPGNSLYNTNNFCVAKYEMKAVATSAPTVGLTTPLASNDSIDNNVTATTSASSPPRAIASVASGYPVSNVTRPTAATYCSNAAASLITNAEWMTIARNIEAQGSNWTGGVVGSGQLWRGNADNDPSALKVLAASTDDNQGYEGTLNSSPSTEKRTHTLSNGQVIWDLSGNLWEWTNDTIIGQDKPTNSSGNQNVPIIYGYEWQEWTVISNWGALGPDMYRPGNNTWNSGQNMGLHAAGSLTGGPYGFLRGGGKTDPSGPITGIYSLILGFLETSTNLHIGFRCVIK